MMNRMKWMLAAIAVITLLGAGITAYTSKMIEKQESAAATDTMLAADGPAEAGGAVSPERSYPEEQMAVSNDVADTYFSSTVGVVEGVPRNKEKAAEEKQSEAAAAASPVEGVQQDTYPAAVQRSAERSDEEYAEAAAGGSGIPGNQADVGDEKAIQQSASADVKAEMYVIVERDDSSGTEPYSKRLEELEDQAEKLRSQDGTTNQYTIRNAADSEWKLWDTELNAIYNKILDSLSREDAEALVKEEREWVITRDGKAAKAAKDYGGSMESVEYRMSLAATTRERVYELADRYGQYLTYEP
ncbi:lysozyme inhibitor LprI family protein [Clostridium sp. AM58-1XD]|uniref:lysozyme inhibitor LprI family protein n=1 Tax=Clostridium sp. AM58-1XD TaxID=2292307 RepID=UPI0015F3B5EF|nr:lysozyme inhibitor LprI family protein [Clostridium sp. AM58-1XD]